MYPAIKLRRSFLGGVQAVGASLRRYKFMCWLQEIQDEHPDCVSRPTRYGCAVYDAEDTIVKEYDYDA